MNTYGAWVYLLIVFQGHRDISVRDAATESLRLLGPSTSAWLEATRGIADAEIVFRSMRIQEKWYSDWIDSWGTLPWIESFRFDRAFPWSNYVCYVEEHDRDYHSYRLGTKFYLLDRMLNDG